MNKKILTMDDLYSFYHERNVSCSFSSKEEGYQISVQVPAQFEINKEQDDDSILFCKVKLMHSGTNRNHSCVTDEALYNCAKTVAYKPILANFTEYEEDGETLKDFTSHDMKYENGEVVEYLEKQVGCFTSDEPYFEIEKSTNHNFMYCYAAIPRNYTDTVSILERKNGSKISAELAVNSVEYDAKTKTLLFKDVTLLGATLLGRDSKTGKTVNEGMKNARIDIMDFSIENNSVFANYANLITEFQDRLKRLETACFNNSNDMKGGNQRMNNELFQKLLAKYNKTAEDITFEYENLNDEELTAKFAEVFQDETDSADEGDETPVSEPTEDTNDQTEDGDGEESPTEPSEPKEDEPEEDKDPTAPSDDEPVRKKKYSVEFNGKTRTFEISCNEKIQALAALVNETYSDNDNAWYGVKVYSDHLIMTDYWNDKYYKQGYSQTGDAFVLQGERTEVYVNYLTKEQEDELAKLQEKYAAAAEELQKYKSDEEFADKMSVFEDEAYAEYLDTDEFKSLMSRESVDKFTKDELAEKADATFAKILKKNKSFSFSKADKPKKKVSKIAFHAERETDETYKPYGELF